MVRSLLLAALTGVLFCAACAGSASYLSQTGGPAAAPPVAGNAAGGLGDLPAPKDVSAGASVITVDSGTSSHLIQTSLFIDHDGVGITAEAPDYFFNFAGRTPEQISHKFFIIMYQQGAAVTMGQLSLDLEWQDAVPAGSDGFYVGVADQQQGSWRWLGPIRSAADIMDYSSFGLTGDPAQNNRLQIALVNYSEAAVKLKYISFTTVDPELSTGDESVFFITSDAGGFALNQATTANLDAVTTLRAFEPGTQLANLAVRDAGADSRLVFDLKTGAGPWEVWETKLDGSELQLRYGGASDVHFAGFNGDYSREFTLVEDNTPFGTVQRHDPALGVVDLERALPGAIVGAPKWYIAGSPDVSLYGTGLDESAQPMAMQYNYYQMWDIESYQPLLFLSDGMRAKDPDFFIWGHGQDPSSNSMALFSGKHADAGTFDIFLNIFCTIPDANNQPFISDPTADLEFPLISPDHKLLSFLRSAPDAATGQLVVQSAFLREVDATAVVAENVVGAAAWFDPTPIN